MLVCGVKLEKNIGETKSLMAELYENGREESTRVLLSGVPEVEKKVSHMCWPGGGGAFDVLDDRGASDGQCNKLPWRKAGTIW